MLNDIDPYEMLQQLQIAVVQQQQAIQQLGKICEQFNDRIKDHGESIDYLIKQANINNEFNQKIVEQLLGERNG